MFQTNGVRTNDIQALMHVIAQEITYLHAEAVEIKAYIKYYFHYADPNRGEEGKASFRTLNVYKNELRKTKKRIARLVALQLRLKNELKGTVSKVYPE